SARRACSPNRARRRPNCAAASPRPAAPPTPRWKPSRPAACASWSTARSATPPNAAASCPRPMTERTPRIAAAIVLGLALAGCGSGAPGPASDQGQAHAQREAAMQVGDIVVRANALPTADLNDAVARQYGIERDDGSVMLLVGVRRDGDGGETALTARGPPVAIELLGKRQDPARPSGASG